MTRGFCSKNYSRVRAVLRRLEPNRHSGLHSGLERRPLTVSSTWKAAACERARKVMHDHERMRMVTIPTLMSDRLILRPFTTDDAGRIHDLLNTPEISDTTLNVPYPYPDGAAKGWIGTHAQAAADGKGWTWAITRRSDDVLMGAIGIDVVVEHQRGALGYWLGVPFWSQGYMSEAARAVVTFGFDTLGLHRIEAACLTRNPASARVMEKAGLVYESTARDFILKHGIFEDLATYALLSGDPPRVRRP